MSDTALLVAYHRAMESRRPDALFHDDFAVRACAARGEAIARRLRYGRRMAPTTIVRTLLFDELVLRLVAQGADAVVNLAAGLDARPYRLPLPPSLRWVEVDLPAMIREKTEALASEKPRCRVERVALDLAQAEPRRELFARIGRESADVLVLSEGLLVYLAPEDVAGLAEDLRGAPCVRNWVIDLVTPAIRKRVNRWWGKQLERAGTKYQFAPEEGTRFFEPHGWREAEFHDLYEGSVRYGRPMSRAWELAMRVMTRLAPRRAARLRAQWRAGIVLLERNVGGAGPTIASGASALLR